MNRGIGGQDHRKGEAMTAADVCDLSDAGKVVVFEQRGAQSAMGLRLCGQPSAYAVLGSTRAS
jgi:hypothetical protein